MTGNLISSATDTDVRIGVVAALCLAIVVTLAAIETRHSKAATEPGGTITLSGSAPELVRPSPKMIARGQPELGVAVE